MEFELIIAKFLYKHGHITLPGIGLIEMTNGAPDPEYVSKNRNIPVDNIAFTYKPGVEIQPEFVNFFAEQKGKIKSLALSDIESKLQLTKQLLNIGNPYEVQGVGIFTKQNDGSLKLEPGFYVNINQELVNKGYRLKEREQPQNVLPNADEEGEGRLRNLKPFLWIIGLLGLVAIGWLGYNFLIKGAGSGNETDPLVAATDTAGQNLPAPDTAGYRYDSANINVDTNNTSQPGIALGDTATFKVYMREINGKTEAMSRFRNTYSRWDNKVYVETADSSLFKFYVLIKMAVADTTAKRDSLERFYQYKVRYEPVGR